jgi:hypothetical protein
VSYFLPRRAIDGLHRAAKLLKNGPDDDLIDAAFEVHEGKPRAPLTGANATVILFDKERAAQLLAFFAGRAI